jgi:hypothetical protein
VHQPCTRWLCKSNTPLTTHSHAESPSRSLPQGGTTPGIF